MSTSYRLLPVVHRPANSVGTLAIVLKMAAGRCGPLTGVGRFRGGTRRRSVGGHSAAAAGRFMRVLSADYDHRWPIGHHTPLSAGRKYGGGGGGRSPAADKQPARFINTAAGHNLDAGRLMEGAAAEFTTSPSGSARRCGDSVRNSGGSSDCGRWWG